MAANSKIGYLQKAIVSTDTTSFLIGFLPPGAFITAIKVLLSTAYDTGAVLDIGTDTTANKFANDVNVATTGAATVTLTASCGVVQSTTDQTQVKGIVVSGGSTFVAGAGRIIVEYAYNE